MSQEVFQIIQKMNLRNIETQLAMKCAPLVTGLTRVLNRQGRG
ncbi:hypothetical protein [Anaerocolumna aminovalerica]|nr:hypothetical protein [Anaerocolumna aminovalerica]